MTDNDIENEIQNIGLTAPRITVAHINQLMAQVVYHYHVVPDTCTTVATAVLPMGNSSFTLATDYSACASPENFNANLGREIACDNAYKKSKDLLWLLEGYVLKKQLVKDEQ